MNIVLYKNPSENNVIGKTSRLITVATINNAIVKGNMSIETPEIILAFNSSYKNNFNYVYISEYNRYYFVDDIIDLTGGRIEIHCRVDVLESFKASIKELECIIDKQQDTNKTNMYYNDGSFKNLAKEFIYTKNFTNGFNENGEFILITAGGVPISGGE